MTESDNDMTEETDINQHAAETRSAAETIERHAGTIDETHRRILAGNVIVFDADEVNVLAQQADIAETVLVAAKRIRRHLFRVELAAQAIIDEASGHRVSAEDDFFSEERTAA